MRFRTITLVALLSAWVSCSIFAQSKIQPVYTIHIGVFVESTAAHFDGVRSMGFPYAISAGNNMHRIYMGGYTSEIEAKEAAQTLRARGFQDASVLELDPNRGQMVSVIQIATKLLKQDLSWDDYKEAGPLNVILNDQYIKITTGVFTDINSAKAQLPAIRKMGFKDAFIKNINSVFLHDINDFYPEATYTPPPQPAQGMRTVPQNVPAPYDQPSNIPTPYNQPTSTFPPAADVPTPYNQPRALGPAPLPVNETSLAPIPSIRSKVKRNSAYKLQELMKNGKFYTSKVDGYYGKGTTSAYAAAVEANPQLKKYSYLADQMSTASSQATPGSVQYAIDQLAENPGTALPILQGSGLPVARAYLAYYQLATAGPSQQVNSLMNTAILEAYAKAVRPPRTRFDYTSTYAYNDLSQLLPPLAYIQVVANPKIKTPCWLLLRHAEEAINAFRRDPALPSANYAMPDCGGFMEWSEIRTLISIAKDMSGTTVDEYALSQGRAQAMHYLLNPDPLSDIDEKSADNWHNRMVTGVNGWANKDLMFGDIANAYQLMYFQSYVLLEDFYMNKGLKASEAKGLAQATLRALIGPYMTRFV